MLEFEGMIRVLLAEQGTIEDLRATLETMRRQSVAARELFAAPREHPRRTRRTLSPSVGTCWRWRTDS